MVKQALSFWLIGLVGFAVDASVLYFLRIVFDADLFAARLFSLAAAMSVSWFLNRNFTFLGENDRGAFSEWLYYLSVNSVGAGINYFLFMYLAMSNAYLKEYLIIPLAVASAFAFVVNFLLSKFLIFRHA